ncbi:hypothetical protein [Salibacterium aidingense]|uniref:hypothetical protein n=1 Tax=Salibacterium aidingense TaxID=384933 RepID=UPI00047C85EA|nr:hypothetical protein [Salibacterium aidingense]
MNITTFIVLWSIFFLVLYLVVKAAVRNGMDSSHTHRILQEYIDFKTPEKAEKNPVDRKTFNMIHRFFIGKNLPLEEVINTPFDNIYFVKTKEEHFFVHVGEDISLIEQEEVKEEWKHWLERFIF